MKPENWKTMDENEKRQLAKSLLNSMRGQLLIGQALAIASRALKDAPHPDREISNAEDMEMIGESLFSPFFQIK